MQTVLKCLEFKYWSKIHPKGNQKLVHTLSPSCTPLLAQRLIHINLWKHDQQLKNTYAFYVRYASVLGIEFWTCTGALSSCLVEQCFQICLEEWHCQYMLKLNKLINLLTSFSISPIEIQVIVCLGPLVSQALQNSRFCWPCGLPILKKETGAF